MFTNIVGLRIVFEGEATDRLLATPSGRKSMLQLVATPPSVILLVEQPDTSSTRNITNITIILDWIYIYHILKDILWRFPI